MALTLTDDQAAALLDALGLPADTTDAQLVDTAKDLAAQAEALDPAKPSTVAAAAKRNGLEVIDKDTAQVLRRDAAEGRRIKAAAEFAKVEASVDDAISKGKITPSRRGHWVTLIQADPGMAEVLASVPNETAVPMTELGHSLEPADSAEAGWFYSSAPIATPNSRTLLSGSRFLGCSYSGSSRPVIRGREVRSSIAPSGRTKRRRVPHGSANRYQQWRSDGS